MFNHLIAKLKSESGQVNAPVKDDKAGVDQSSSQDSQADKLEGLVHDLDFNDVPENIRKEVIKYTAQKTKLYDAGFQAKAQDLATQRKSLTDKEAELRDIIRLNEEVKGNPDLEKAIIKLINDSRSGKPLTQKTVDKNLRKLDQLIEETGDYSTKDQLRQMRDIILEESGSDSLKEELKLVKDELASLKRSASAGVSGRIGAEKGKLEEKFGEELIGKYWKDIESMASKYPEYLSNNKFTKLLYHFAEDLEIETALLDKAKEKQQQEIERKKRGSISDTTSSVSSTIEIPHDKSGRIRWGEVFKKARDAGKFKI